MAIPWRNFIQTDMGYDRGNIGKGGIGGGIRMAQIDERTKVRVSQTLKKNLAKQKASWGGASTVKKQVSGNEFSRLLPFSSASIIRYCHRPWFSWKIARGKTQLFILTILPLQERLLLWPLHLYKGWKLSIPKLLKRRWTKPMPSISQHQHPLSKFKHQSCLQWAHLEKLTSEYIFKSFSLNSTL